MMIVKLKLNSFNLVHAPTNDSAHILILEEPAARDLYAQLGAVFGMCPKHDPGHEADYPYKQCKHCGSAMPGLHNPSLHG